VAVGAAVSGAAVPSAMPLRALVPGRAYDEIAATRANISVGDVLYKRLFEIAGGAEHVGG
jgi:hypothetical protein